LNINFETKKIETSLFIKDIENPSAPPKPVVIDDIDRLDQFLKKGSIVRLIVRLSKMWADKTNKEDVGRKYCLAFKIMSIEITPSNDSGDQFKQNFNAYAFDPEDHDNNTNDNNTNDNIIKNETNDIPKTLEEAQKSESRSETDDESEN